MTDQPSLETLQDGLSSPFWAWFSAYATKEYGPASLWFQQRIREAAKDPNAVLELQKALAAQEAVYALMRHPSELLRIAQAKTLAEVVGPSASRRGPGL